MVVEAFQRDRQCGRAAAGTAARRQRGHDAVRAQLDLPDFFENLAGNHGEIGECRLPSADFKPAKTPACVNKPKE